MKKDKMVTFAVNSNEYKKLVAEAEKHGLTVSQYCRTMILYGGIK